MALAGGAKEYLHRSTSKIVKWGRSSAPKPQQDAAAEFDAGPLGVPGEDGVHGWRDLDLHQAVRRAIALEDWQHADPQRRIKVDFRPHSHHWQVMAELRASPHGTGHIQVGGARMLCMRTGEWGDGIYPVHTDHDAQGRLLQARIILGDEERRQRTEEFRERWSRPA